MLAVQSPGRTIIPTLRYRDVAAAVDWLCAAFGFERHLVVPGENGGVRYAELTFGDGMIMLGPVQDSPFDGLMMQPADAGGAETQICYLFVEDAGEHCAMAKAAGAEIVLDIKEDDGGGRGYSSRDLEGHIWNVGTYNPWMRQPAPASLVDPPERRSNWGRGLRRVAAMAGLLVTVAGSALVVGWALGAIPSFGSQPAAVTSMGADAPPDVEQSHPTRARDERDFDEREIKDLREQLGKERNAKEAAERDARAASDLLTHTERTATETREQLVREKTNREIAERVAQEKHEQLAAERGGREAAERAKQQQQEAKQTAREKREAKERAAKEAQKRQRRPASHSQAAAAGPAFPLW